MKTAKIATGEGPANVETFIHRGIWFAHTREPQWEKVPFNGALGTETWAYRRIGTDDDYVWRIRGGRWVRGRAHGAHGMMAAHATLPRALGGPLRAHIVTHAPTGLRAYVAPTKKEAKAVCRLLAERAATWAQSVAFGETPPSGDLVALRAILDGILKEVA